MITFDSISSTNRLPGSQVEFSNVRAVIGLPAAVQKILLVGQRLTSGTVAQLIPKRITQVEQGAAYFGRGSILAGMVAAALLANSATEMWAIGIDDNGAGTAATKTVTLSGTATAAGTLALMVENVAVPVAVASGDTATAIGAAAAAAINALADLPCTAASVTGTVTLTFRHKGTAGNDLDVRVNHYEGPQLPAGVTVAIAAGVTGATNPDLTTVWAAIGDEAYQQIALGINDATNLTATDTELVSRFGPGRQNEGHAWAGLSGSFSTCSSFGATRNGIHVSLLPTNNSPTPPWKLAAAITAIAAYYYQIDPARPLTNIVLPGVIAPKVGARFSDSELNQLLNAGISVWKVLPGGEVGIKRLVTTYQTNAYGFPDISWLDVSTPMTLAYLRFSWRSMIAAKFPREKNTDATRSAIRAETIALARDWIDAGLIEDIDTFIANLVVERSSSDPVQSNVLMTPNLVNGLLKSAARIEFIL
ncbi:MAG: phage tail sheath subtilisin-like domain-containing protein [Sphingomonas sp.]